MGADSGGITHRSLYRLELESSVSSQVDSCVTHLLHSASPPLWFGGIRRVFRCVFASFSARGYPAVGRLPGKISGAHLSQRQSELLHRVHRSGTTLPMDLL